MTPILAAIQSRCSVGPRHLTGPALTMEELDLLAQAAAAAPDHGRVGPARLIHIPATARDALADAFARAAVEAAPDADTEILARARDRALAGPNLIALVARIEPDHATVSAQDQWLSVGAALQNVLLTAESLGLRAKMLSGNRVRSVAMRHALNLMGTEHLAGFVALGHCSDAARPRSRRNANEIMSVWPAP
jgi:nitroreductase